MTIYIEYQPSKMVIDADNKGVSLAIKTYTEVDGERYYANEGKVTRAAFRTVNVDENDVETTNANFAAEVEAFTGVSGLGDNLLAILS